MECISIIGGGLVGSALAMFLTRRGHRVTVFERHPDLRASSAASGRSINLTLCERGLVPLGRIGVRDQIEALGKPAYGRIMHAVDGRLSSQPYGNRGEALFSVPRNALNAALMTLAEERFGVRFEFD
ncbi:MAG: FAD-dependent oxidoreductase, partial [Thermoanaerobaculia bacterium]